MAHTPGDWWLVELDAKLDDWTGARFVIRQPKHAPGGVAIIMGGLGEQEERDNAYLLKAAPKLLAALRELLPKGWDDGTMDHMPGVQAAREAIAEATADRQ